MAGSYRSVLSAGDRRRSETLTREPTASIVVVNYNGRALLDPCLRATLPQASALGAEAIVVDNGSTDDSVDFVCRQFPDVVLIQSARNEGFAGGANIGTREARSDCVVLLNNDAVPEEGWLEHLLRALDAPDVAIAASVIEEARYPAAYALGTGTVSVIGHPIPSVLPDPTAPFYATGTALAFKRPLFPEPFPAVYFAYYEDLLLSWRARLRGYTVARALGSRVRHLGGATARRRPSEATFYWERNKLLTLLLCYEPRTIARLLPLYLFDGIVRLAEDLWHAVSWGKRNGGHRSAAARHYRIALRGLAWLLLHRNTVGRLRAEIQAERKVSDESIIRLLSGKVFDDFVPTPGHRLANRLALAYCRLAGIETADVRGQRNVC